MLADTYAVSQTELKRIVCIDGGGKVRAIDWHLAEPCCRGECREPVDLTDDISSDLP